jgi:hypothetical protein
VLTENDVVAAVCAHLEDDGYQIVEQCTTQQQGTDIVACHPEHGSLHIEAKGETSSRSSSARYGKQFNSAQVRDHVANAVYTALRLHGKGDTAAMAFPDTDLHQRYLEPVRSILRGLGIKIYMVGSDRRLRLL